MSSLAVIWQALASQAHLDTVMQDLIATELLCPSNILECISHDGGNAFTQLCRHLDHCALLPPLALEDSLLSVLGKMQQAAAARSLARSLLRTVKSTGDDARLSQSPRFCRLAAVL